MKKFGLLAGLLAISVVLLYAQTSMVSPPAPYNTYFAATDGTGVTRPLIGINTSNEIQLDPDDRGARFGSTVAIDGALTLTGALNALSTWIFEGTTVDNSETTLTVQDPSADRTATLPDATGPVHVGIVRDVIFCGDLTDHSTNYASPVTGYAGGNLYSHGNLTTSALQSYALAGAGCSTEDNATETTADEVMFANNALKVLGMTCSVDSSGTQVTFTLRSSAADLTPTVSVVIPTSTTTGATVTTTTTDIAAGATVAMRAVTPSDLASNDFWCMAQVLVVP